MQNFDSLKCTPFNNNEYDILADSLEDWFCNFCLTTTFPFNHIDDDTDFLLALHEFNSDMHYNFDSFKDLIFNSFDLSTSLTNINDIDPDKQFFYADCESNYIIEDDFISKYSLTTNYFSLIHFNARSLPHNFDKITNYLDLLKFPFSIIGVTETWLSNATDWLHYKHEHYKLITCNRDARQGGGVALYLNDNICQPIFAEIKLGKTNIKPGVIYRPPDGNINLFNDYIENTLNKLNNYNKHIYYGRL